ncbi:MAG: 5'/3'-nucleotidase SurE [Desulfuromonas sp.]|nr:MAG: 5'/3'-nucleotidase SurE [Desulfuromonas sp.]
MLILVTNDDGVQSPGITALVSQLRQLGRVVVVAPDRERSAVGRALTLHLPLRAEVVGPDCWAVSGTPTDCVNLGIQGLLESRPDLVVSGINKGANMGDDLTYSGTVAAAMEATLMGVPSFAVSLSSSTFAEADFAHAAQTAGTVARLVMQHGLLADTFLNVNVPAGKPHGLRLTRQGKRTYQEAVVHSQDPRGRSYFWIGAGELGFQDLEGTDFHAVARGYVSLTPLHLDLTNYAAFDRVRQWTPELVQTASDEEPHL